VSQDYNNYTEQAASVTFKNTNTNATVAILRQFIVL